MRGHSTSKDYETLLSLSNSSRQDAIETFSLLSQRLSRSSLALVPLSPGLHQPHKRRTKKKTAGTKAIEYTNHTRSKSAPELSVAATPLGLATPEGWVRPKTGRKHSSDSSKSSSTRSGTTSPRRSTTKPRSPAPISAIHERTSHGPRTPHSPPPAYQSKQSSPLLPSPAPQQIEPIPPAIARRPFDPTKRRSIMSFASDSTKLGEIPEHKWARQGMLEAGNFPILTYYPMEPYQEPEKPRSRLRKLFRR